MGLQTAVDFLNSKGEQIEADMNVKITDEQYALLQKEFKRDSELRDAANTMQQKQKEEKERKQQEQKAKRMAEEAARKKAEEEARRKAEEEAKAARELPGPKVVGHIDLDKKPEPVADRKDEEPVVAMGEEAEVQPATDGPQVITDGKVTGTLENGVFRLNAPQQSGEGLKIQGKIDLSAINQSTRPKKKSRDERRREREEKMQQNAGKKRERIGGKEKVDVNAGAQQNQQGGGKNKNKSKNKSDQTAMQGSGQNQQGGGKKKKKNQPKQAPQPVEVSEEEVAKQVRETLARLTSKTKTSKGAKYRREKRDAIREHMEEELINEMAENKVLKLTEFVTANELATMMNVPVTQIIGTCMQIGIMVSINQRPDGVCER